MILVTGSHGFVGRALTEALRREMPEKTILAPSSRELNLLDHDATLEYFQKNKIECVFHLAAKLGGVDVMANRSLEFLEKNLVINHNIMCAAIAAGIRKFITLGSSCSYSKDLPLPNHEKDFWNGHPENTYGVCKLVLLEYLRNQNTMDWVYLVPPNIYGPGDHFGEQNAHFIPATVMKLREAAISGSREIEVWGDGTQTRDFVYIDDIVYFLIEAYRNEQYSGRVLNIGTGDEVSIRQVVELIRNILGLSDKVTIRWAMDKPTGTKRKVLSNAELLKLHPQYNFVDIQQGLEKTLQGFHVR